MPLWRCGLIPWMNRKVVDPFLQIIKKGAEPKQLAFSAALGMSLGLFPICGVTVFLCGMAIAILRHHCHAPSVMLANFVATPIELSMVIPFLRLGELITGGRHFPLTSDALSKVVSGQASQGVLIAILHAGIPTNPYVSSVSVPYQIGIYCSYRAVYCSTVNLALGYLFGPMYITYFIFTVVRLDCHSAFHPWYSLHVLGAMFQVFGKEVQFTSF
ncbi:uncharacterized protein LOC135610131 isoform X1 [Musa acuminata AAA Group]|uniref:uncharacterized protein LOC135610131 isoform X1 n=1 Tax=Musa acuminata AAA Group TaxID=214697 RepID=UPI0008A0EA83|nr:PREDICTED: uncharacterized protein LOC103981795 isoform X1 [Musa acuminata subsp. malaccensis]